MGPMSPCVTDFLGLIFLRWDLSGWPRTGYIDQVDPELPEIHLTLSSKLKRHEPPCLPPSFLFRQGLTIYP